MVETETVARNMRLLANHRLEGFGQGGEGMAVQVRPDGRRVLWIAHERDKNFTGIDVSDPRQPKTIVQTELPHAEMRSNSLDLVDNVLVVAYQTAKPGLPNAGVELFDVSDLETPRSIGFWDASSPVSRGAHRVWFADGEYVHCSTGAPGFTPRDPNDDQLYLILDVRNPPQPVEVGRWWLPGTDVNDSEPAPPRNLQINSGNRAHNTMVYPDRPDRCYVGYLDGGTFILDISDKAHPRVAGSWNPYPPYMGFCHTVLPLFEKELLVVTEESVRPNGEDWPKLVWLVDARIESNLVPIGTLPLPPVEEYKDKGGRYGSHNIHENNPKPGVFHSEELIFGTYFNGGVRVHDVSNPLRPEEVACYIPPAPEGGRFAAAQINDVYVDDRRVVYALDRTAGGLYIIELDL